jgi:hypothetical protein
MIRLGRPIPTSRYENLLFELGLNRSEFDRLFTDYTGNIGK